MQSETVTGAPNSGSVSYTLDAVGNRLSRLSTLNSVLSTTATFSANDWLASDTVDNNGNTLVGVNALNAAVGSDYDFEDHLVYQSDGTKTVSLRYDGNGNRVRKTVNDGTNIVTTWYLVEDRNPTGYPQVIEEYVSPNSQPSTLNRVYTYGHERICQDRFDGVNWVVSYYGYDGHGSVRLLTDYGGRATDSYEYDAFGKLIGQSSSFQPPTPNSYLYSGEQWDADLGFYYNRARYLNPDTGRFWNMDTHEGDNEDPLSLHKYIYARHNPVDRIDPSGHDDIVSLSVATAMRGAVAGAVLGSISAGFTYAKTGSITAAAQSGLMTYSTVFLATICPLGGLAIGGGSIFSLGINAWVDGITAADAFEMGTMLAASLALHATFSRYGPGFTNVREGPTTTTPTTYTNSQLANRMNKFNYVVTEEGEAIIGPRNQSHVELSQGKPLLAAGEVKIINGQVKLINNASGHYQPSGPMARIAAIKSLKLRGYDEAAGRYVEKTFAMPRPIKIPGWDAATTASAGMSGMDWDDMEN
ncbi:MAG: RHS repeat-associated core domain-containing protein [Nitrosomonadaceae bacterium]|nr:RHS repeat-associated core domain-containing protein [Nitrosomonadaceae bacterium]